MHWGMFVHPVTIVATRSTRSVGWCGVFLPFRQFDRLMHNVQIVEIAVVDSPCTGTMYGKCQQELLDSVNEANVWVINLWTRSGFAAKRFARLMFRQVDLVELVESSVALFGTMVGQTAAPVTWEVIMGAVFRPVGWCVCSVCYWGAVMTSDDASKFVPTKIPAG